MWSERTSTACRVAEKQWHPASREDREATPPSRGVLGDACGVTDGRALLAALRTRSGTRPLVTIVANDVRHLEGGCHFYQLDARAADA